MVTRAEPLLGLILAAAFAANAVPAGAATVSGYLDLTGSAGQASQLTFSDGIVSATVEAKRMRANGTIGGKRIITQTADGLGAKTGWNDSDLLDNTVQDEAIRFIFDTAVKIEKIVFSFVDEADVFAFSILGGKTVSSFFDGLSLDTTGIGTFTFSEDIVSDMFAIGLIGEGMGVKIRGIGYAVETPAPVPLPAAGGLLLVGLGGLAALRRKASTA